MEEETKVALAHGITMGGGASLMVPMKFSVVSEKTVFCMPEASIGFHTDCSFSYILSRLPGHMGVASMITIESTESLSSMVSSKVDIIRKGNHVGPKVPISFSRVSSEDSPVFTEW
ncbi:3-hydroxyisobutyryl-CoA hydrolase [Ranunculus cassubicifolius]